MRRVRTSSLLIQNGFFSSIFGPEIKMTQHRVAVGKIESWIELIGSSGLRVIGSAAQGRVFQRVPSPRNNNQESESEIKIPAGMVGAPMTR